MLGAAEYYYFYYFNIIFIFLLKLSKMHWIGKLVPTEPRLVGEPEQNNHIFSQKAWLMYILHFTYKQTWLYFYQALSF